MIKYTLSDLTFIYQQILISEAHAAGTPLTALVPDPLLSWGLRTVNGTFNNLVPGRSTYGSADQVFPRMLTPDFRPADAGTTYQQTSGTVVDSQARLASNLIVDQTADNPAAVQAAGPNAEVSQNGSLSIPNVTPDMGLSAPFNSWMTLFGQFFDHGLDLVTKGGSGTVFVPLQPDDPLYVAGGPNFLVVTRATNQPGPDGTLGTADDIHEQTNTTTPWVDQNQTYTSHASHQVFLREYALDANGKPEATGRLLNGASGGLPTWADVKAQALAKLGIVLTDADVTNVPLLATDEYGRFLRGPNGYVQMVVRNADGSNGLLEGSNGGTAIPANIVRTGHAFLDDIAHEAAPTGKTADGDSQIGLAAGANPSTTYDNELLDRHFVTGDGRGNENIGLTSVHHIFHSEHNRLVEHTKQTILASGDPVFIQQWLMPGADPAAANLDWNGERLFQAAKFGTEMQYQHLVFEEFARTVQPAINIFPGTISPDLDPTIVAEFAHAVYRFGHSMLTETIARTNADGTPNDIGLIEAFLNPVAFDENGTITADQAAGAIVRGMTRQVGNEIDEFVTEALRNNLLGLPLDLATINIVRARDAGVPSLNDARAQFYTATNSSFLKPYDSWYDFAVNLKHSASVINFIAAYGTHETITAATTLADKRAAATDLVMGGAGAPADRMEYLTSTGQWSTVETGLNLVDFWIGGLAEKQMPFGGLLGSTFNYVFETQLERLQDGDRFYYLLRLQGLNLLNEIEGNSFTAIVMANTDLGDPGSTHLPATLFTTPAYILEADLARQIGPEPVGTDPVLEAIQPLVSRDGNNDGLPDGNYLRYRGADHVVVGGTELNDTLISGDGDDTVWGDGGNDRIEGGAGIDNLRGGAGDDIITDSGDADIIHGDQGNDVIAGGNGLDVILAGDGNDAVLCGVDGAGVTGEGGNDFLLGGVGADALTGNDGDDWLEGGAGVDGLTGDNAQAFPDSTTVVGHDVLIGDGGDSDYLGEAGDDIMAQGQNVDLNDGGFGFDWAIHKGDPIAANSDLNIPIFTTVTAELLRDRFNQVEGLSGWQNNDILRGDDRGALGVGITPSLNDALTQSGIARIAGLQAVLGAGVTSFGTGNIILGGGGSDQMEGRGADDIIDGDHWLNVRISVRDANDPTLEIRTINSLSEIQAELLAGTINPGQLQVVREVLNGNVVTDTDIAVFSGNRANYTITPLSATSVRVVDTRGIDSTTIGDVVSNVEILRFADGDVRVNQAPVITTNGGNPLVLTMAENQLAGSMVVDVNATDGNPGDTLTWSITGGNAQNLFAINAATGVVSWASSPNYEALLASGATNQALTIQVSDGLAVATLQVNVAITNVNEAPVVSGPVTLAASTEDMLRTITAAELLANAVDPDGNTPLSILNLAVSSGTLAANPNGSWSFTPALNDDTAVTFTYTVSDGTLGTAATASLDLLPVNDIVGTNAGQTSNGSNLADHMYGNGGNDRLNGNGGNDVIYGGSGNDNVSGGSGNDLIMATVEIGSDGNDSYNGGSGIDTYDLSKTSANATVNLATGRASSTQTGSDTLNAVENVVGGQGNDVITGSTGNNTLQGGAGNDALNGGGGFDVLSGGVGADRFVFSGNPQSTIGTRPGARDQITDFQQGADIIDLSAIDANASTGANNAFVFVGLNPTTTNIAGQLGYRFETDVNGVAHTIVEGTINTRAGMDFQLDLVGMHNLTQNDFVL